MPRKKKPEILQPEILEANDASGTLKGADLSQPDGELLSRLERHDDWLRDEGGSRFRVTPGEIFRKIDFSAFVLDKAFLNNTSFEDCKFGDSLNEVEAQYTTWTRCDMEGTIADYAFFENAKFIDCALKRFGFSSAQMRGATVTEKGETLPWNHGREKALPKYYERGTALPVARTNFAPGQRFLDPYQVPEPPKQVDTMSVMGMTSATVSNPKTQEEIQEGLLTLIQNIAAGGEPSSEPALETKKKSRGRPPRHAHAEPSEP